ncbi:hypothetical protein CCACVL1_09324 [Corchorus capsularis]|uniref:Uncharacterized protein n=1 Tax=Corchorus capsularis TaxID=210143 RepID=A0A1R3IWV3_COCAP|nr:hypothetical protein CCACVL1_09324 [Corchorus capsularis]
MAVVALMKSFRTCDFPPSKSVGIKPQKYHGHGTLNRTGPDRLVLLTCQRGLFLLVT